MLEIVDGVERCSLDRRVWNECCFCDAWILEPFECLNRDGWSMSCPTLGMRKSITRLASRSVMLLFVFFCFFSCHTVCVERCQSHAQSSGERKDRGGICFFINS
ncbi:hypothetical protein BSKO_03131 [Bryopsis sp. KO-2023]|nr:hypothetical protein BSKO_03131 [Bryopsis sp. KO-2023]